MKGHSVNAEPNSVINNGDGCMKVCIYIVHNMTTDEFSTWEQKKIIIM